MQYLSDKFGDEYPHADRHLRRIKAISGSLSDNENDPEALAQTQKQFDELQHRVLVLDNRLLNCGKLLFVKRYTHQSRHCYNKYLSFRYRFGILLEMRFEWNTGRFRLQRKGAGHTQETGIHFDRNIITKEGDPGDTRCDIWSPNHLYPSTGDRRVAQARHRDGCNVL